MNTKGNSKPTSDEPKPDGVEVPFGHELFPIREGEPLILIRGAATLVQRLNAGVHVVSSCINQMIENDARLVRARDAAIAHIMKNDVKGAVAALTTQRDSPELFDRMKFEGDPE